MNIDPQALVNELATKIGALSVQLTIAEMRIRELENEQDKGDKDGV